MVASEIQKPVHSCGTTAKATGFNDSFVFARGTQLRSSQSTNLNLQIDGAVTLRKTVITLQNGCQLYSLASRSISSFTLKELALSIRPSAGSTPSSTIDAHAPVADGVLVDLPLWGTSVINLAVECADGRYFGSLTALSPVYDHVLKFLKRNHVRKLREVMDVSDVVQ
jgi:hypothetical protein